MSIGKSGRNSSSAVVKQQSSVLVLDEGKSQPAQAKEANEENNFISQEFPGIVACQAIVLQYALPKQLHLHSTSNQVCPDAIRPSLLMPSFYYTVQQKSAAAH